MKNQMIRNLLVVVALMTGCATAELGVTNLQLTDNAHPDAASEKNAREIVWLDLFNMEITSYPAIIWTTACATQQTFEGVAIDNSNKCKTFEVSPNGVSVAWTGSLIKSDYARALYRWNAYLHGEQIIIPVVEQHFVNAGNTTMGYWLLADPGR